MKVSLFAFGVLFACVCTVAQAQDVDFLTLGDAGAEFQAALTGLASAAGGTINVGNIYNCGFASIADTLVSGLTDLITEASSCNPSKVSDIEAKLQTLLADVPASVTTCLQSNTDAQALLTGLGVAGQTQDQIQTAITNWITNNPLTACWDLQGLYSDVNGGDFQKFGSDAGALIKKIFKSSKILRAHKDNIAQILTGVNSNIQDQADVNSIVSCGSETTYTAIDAAILPIMDEAASCDPTKMDDIAAKVNTLIQAVPASEQQCFSSNADVQKLLKGLGVAGLSPSDIKSKVTSYVLSHILSICGTIDGLNKKIKGGDYLGFGTDAGKLVVNVFKSSKMLGAHKDNIAQILTGVNSNIQDQADVNSIVSCGSETTYTAIDAAILPIMDEAASCDPTKMDDIAAKVNTLIQAVPASEQQCFSSNADVQKLLKGLGVAGLSPSDIKSKVTSYVLSHILSICGTIDGLNKKIKGGDYLGFGTDAGKLVVNVFKLSTNQKIAREITFALMMVSKLQANLDGFADLLGGFASATSAKGADTKTTAKCTDEATAGTLLTAIADLTKTASTCDLTKVTDLVTKAKAVVDAVPAAHKQCFAADPAIKQIGTALGVVGAKPDQLVQKVLTYAIGHFSEVCSTIKTLDTDASGAAWNQYGADAGALAVKILA